MPRLATSLLRKAWTLNPLLPILLRTCRTLASAKNELRWLREHVTEKSDAGPLHKRHTNSLLKRLCLQRGQGVPLQYLLGSQPFGELDILCRPGVLIPRPETETYTAKLAEVIRKDPDFQQQQSLRVLDLCTGTGCISLSLYSLLADFFPKMEVLCVDISDKALTLAQDNVLHNIKLGNLKPEATQQISFRKADVLHENVILGHHSMDIVRRVWDVVISNPPYISEKGFNIDTNRSVRTYEPRIALVPIPMEANRHSHSIVDTEEGHEPEDVFYLSIIDSARKANAAYTLMEVGDIEQAFRVVRLALRAGCWTGKVEVWRDWPYDTEEVVEKTVYPNDDPFKITVRGQGNCRSVYWKL